VKELGSHLTLSIKLGAYFRTKWYLDPSSPLDTIDMGLKLGGSAPFLGWELGTRLTQSRLGRGLPPYQVVS